MMYVGPRYDEKGRFTLSVYLNTGVRQLWRPCTTPPAAVRAKRNAQARHASDGRERASVGHGSAGYQREAAGVNPITLSAL
jgi:hypothetical protein